MMRRERPWIRWATIMVFLAALLATLRAEGQQSQPLVPRSVLKLIIDHTGLASHFHPEARGRVPLVVSDHLLAEGVTPSKFGHPVLILADSAVRARPYLRFKSFQVQRNLAHAVVEYRVEGVEASFTLSRTDSGWWTIVDAVVSAR